MKGRNEEREGNREGRKGRRKKIEEAKKRKEIRHVSFQLSYLNDNANALVEVVKMFCIFGSQAGDNKCRHMKKAQTLTGYLGSIWNLDRIKK